MESFNTTTLTLSKGSHYKRSDGVCAMEAVAWLAGESHSSRPQCACPIIGNFVIVWNDILPTDEDRNLFLKPLLSFIINTKANKDTEQLRQLIIIDWVVRKWLPQRLRDMDSLYYYNDIIRLEYSSEILHENQSNQVFLDLVSVIEKFKNTTLNLMVGYIQSKKNLLSMNTLWLLLQNVMDFIGFPKESHMQQSAHDLVCRLGQIKA